MKYVCLLISFFLGGTMFASANQSDEIAHLKNLVSQAELQARSFGARDAAGLMDAIPNLSYKPEFRALQKSLATSWQVALSHLDAIAEDDMAKTILLCSCWALSENDYVAFLSSSASLVEEGKLNRDIFRWCQSPMESQLTGFLDRNYEDLRVQEIIMRSRKIFQDQPKRVEQYDGMLTGESRRKMEKFKAAMRGDQASVSSQPQELTIHESVTQDATETLDVAETEKVCPPSVRQAKEDPVKVTPANEAQPEEDKHRFVLPVVIGIIAVLACVGVWFFRRRTAL